MKHDKVPDTVTVYKEECLYCFLTPECSTGLYIPLKVSPHGTYDAVCATHLEWHVTGRWGSEGPGTDVAILRTRRRRLPKAPEEEGKEEGKEPKQKRLAIGLRGGFDTEEDAYESEQSWLVSRFPDVNSVRPYDDPEVEAEVREWAVKLRDTEGAMRLSQLSGEATAWDGELVMETKEKNIPQISSPTQMPECTKNENLWLNLSDGTILCGRRYADGTGGNNHAVEHYENAGRKYPLAVKLGTITPTSADVYSYSENDMVKDPNLAVHLAHFGLNMNKMEKTEKTMLEMELDLNEQHNFRTLCESGATLKEAYGPGLTGIVNLGSSCYMASVIQALLLSPAVRDRFVDGAPGVFSAPTTAHPADTPLFQAAKLFSALQSGTFSPGPSPDTGSLAIQGAMAGGGGGGGGTVEVVEGEAEKLERLARDGVRPLLFRTVLGRGHPEFSTKQQQDAEEYLRHLLDHLPLSKDFIFKTVERFEDLASKRVRYSEKNEVILSVPIPLDLVENKEEVANYRKKEEEAKASKKPIPDDEVVRPRVSLTRCLQRLGAKAHIDGYRSPVTGTTELGASRQMGLKTFPDLLFLHLSRFTVGEDGLTPVKLQASMDIRDVMDLEFLRAKGQQDGELLLDDSEPAWTKPALPEAVVTSLMGMGFGRDAAERAAYETRAQGTSEDAANWLMSHLDDADLNSPHPSLVPPKSGTVAKKLLNEEAEAMLLNFGFTSHQAQYAATKVANLNPASPDINAVAEWLFVNADKVPAERMETGEASSETGSDVDTYSDGTAQYKLVGFVSHMGSSTHSGHYIAHLYKNGKWYIFNDEKVSESQKPPRDLAYIYLFQRVQ